MDDTSPSPGSANQPRGRRNRRLGRHGEELAAAHLRRSGFRVLERNWRCAIGELDIVATAGGLVVGCEVKTRGGSSFGPPQEGVSEQKLARLHRLVYRWASEHELAAEAVRVDLIGVLLVPGRFPRIDHVVGVS